MKSLILLFLLVHVMSIDNNLHVYLVSTSNTFENYRHSTNVMMIYQYFRKVGIPDHNIILALSEAHTCSPRLKYPGKIFLADGSKKTCHNDLFIDYKENDFHNYKFLDLLRGRYPTNQLVISFDLDDQYS